MGTVYRSIIIPTLNEEGSIENVLTRIPERIWREGEVIVVDASTDRTSNIAEKCGAKVIRVGKSGKGYLITSRTSFTRTSFTPKPQLLAGHRLH